MRLGGARHEFEQLIGARRVGQVAYVQQAPRLQAQLAQVGDRAAHVMMEVAVHVLCDPLRVLQEFGELRARDLHYYRNGKTYT